MVANISTISGSNGIYIESTCTSVKKRRGIALIESHIVESSETIQSIDYELVHKSPVQFFSASCNSIAFSLQPLFSPPYAQSIL